MFSLDIRCPKCGQTHEEDRECPTVSRVRCNKCGLWKPTAEIAVIYTSGGVCKGCSEDSGK